MRLILKPPVITPPSTAMEETPIADELLDVVPERIPSSPKSRMDARGKRSRDSSTTQGLRTSKKKGSSRLANTPDKSAGNVLATESTSRLRRRRTSREKRGHRRLSDEETNRDDKQSPPLSEEVDLGRAERREESKAGMSVADISRATSSFGEVPLSATTVEEPTPLTIDSWRTHFPDERVQIKMKHGDHYEGRISRKLMEGDGVFSWWDGCQYSGEFVDGEMTGKGRLMWPDMTWYQGDLVKAWRHGRGLYVSNVKKLAYLGDWVTGRKHGSGLMVYNEKRADLYDGEWRDDLRDGYGLRVYPSGARYLGYWREGLREGVGTMLFANGDVYSGGWEQGVFTGYGEYSWKAFLNRTLACGGDNVHRGWFEQGMRHGEATYELQGGQQIRGRWVRDVKDGTAAVICGDGSAFLGEPMFEDDSPVSKQIPRKAPSGIRRRIKASPSGRIDRKPGRVDSSSLLRHQKKSASNARVIGNVTKAPPPNPWLILHGLYIPVHAPFQNIDLEYTLALLKALKHPTEATGCQTDETICSDDISIEFSERMVADIEFKKSRELVAPSESKIRPQIIPLPNEKSTQTDIPSNNSLDVISEEKGQCTYSAGKIVNVIKKNKVASQSVQDVVKVSSSIFKDGKKVAAKGVKGARRRNLSRKAESKWPTRAKLAYPAGETEQSCEEKWLRQALVRHLPTVRRVYEEYARLGCGGLEPPFQPVLLRMMLWQLYRDCGITSRVSLVQLDRMMADNPRAQVAAHHYPFERILLWQFLYSLIDVSWVLYASQGLGDPNSHGVLGSAFDQLMQEDILSRPAGHKGNIFTEHLDLLPLMPVYLLYRSLGEPLSARRLLQLTYRRKGVESPSERPRPVAVYPEHIADGFNALVMIDGITFLPLPLPLASPEDATYETTSATTLSMFGNVGVEGLTDVLVGVCPGISEEGVIVNMAYEMTFLEFYEVLIECEGRSHAREQRRLARLEALERLKLELEAKKSQELEKVEVPVALPVKSGKVKQKKTSKSKA